MSQTIPLTNPTARQFAMRQIAAAPDNYVAIIKERTRTLDQNAKLHAMLTDISAQATYMGKRRSVEFWKGLFVSGWQIATGQAPEIVPGLEGEFINIRTSTTTLGVRKLAELIEYINAWAAGEGIRFSAPEWEVQG